MDEVFGTIFRSIFFYNMIIMAYLGGYIEDAWLLL